MRSDGATATVDFRQCHCDCRTSNDDVVVWFILLTCHGQKKNSKKIKKRNLLFSCPLENMDEMYNNIELLPMGTMTLGLWDISSSGEKVSARRLGTNKAM